MKRFLVLIVCLLMVSCQGLEQKDILQRKEQSKALDVKFQRIGWNLGVQPTSLDPQFTDDIYGQQVIKQLYTGLFEYRQSKFTHAICRSYDVSEDGLVYKFNLRESAWSDGSPLTAGDFEYAFKRILNKKTTFFNHAYYSGISGYGQGDIKAFGVEAIDDKTLVIKLSYPDPFFLQKLTLPAFMPVKKVSVNSGKEWYHKTKTLITNGPFKLVEVNQKRSYVLHKNPHYYRQDLLKLESIIIEMITEDASKYIAYKTDRVQVVDMVLPSTIDNLRLLRTDLQSFNYPKTTYLQCNVSSKAFLDKNIRRLLSLAIDRQALVDEKTKLGERPASGYIPSTLVFEQGGTYREIAGDFGIDITSVNLTEIHTITNANPEILKAQPTLRLVAHVGAVRSDVVHYLAHMWQSTLGVKTDVILLNWQDYNRVIQEGDYDLALMEETFFVNDISMMLKRFCNGIHWQGWMDNIYYLLIYTADNNSPLYKLDRLIMAEEMLIKDMHVIPLYYGKEHSLVSRNLLHWTKTPTGFWNFSEAYLIDE